MPPNEVTLIIPLAIGFGVQLLITLGLRVWGRWVARRQGGVWWQRASLMPPVALVLATVGIAGTMTQLVRAFERVQTVNPEYKAAALADGISGAMLFTAICGSAAGLLYAASFVTFLVGSIRATAAQS
jgi:hypothetical protein